MPSRCYRHATGELVLEHGVAIGTDLAYWTHAFQLAVSMTAREQFLPSLFESGRADRGGMDSGVHWR